MSSNKHPRPHPLIRDEDLLKYHYDPTTSNHLQNRRHKADSQVTKFLCHRQRCRYVGPDVQDPMVEVKGWQRMGIDKGANLRFQAAMSMLEPSAVSHLRNKDCTQLIRKLTFKISQDQPSDFELLLWSMILDPLLVSDTSKK